MFAIPGILGLLFFIYLRPQEAVATLQDIPFLYMFFGLTVFGVAVDLRLRVNRAAAVPHLPWAVAFYLWAVVSVAINAPDALIRTMVLFAVTVIIFVLIAQGVQTFRMFEVVATAIALLALSLAYIGVDQGMAPYECIERPEGEEYSGAEGAGLGEPDGRLCEDVAECYEGDHKPGTDYWCERVGHLGTHTVSGRVRYRGVLQDPNELGIAIGAGLALILGLWARRRTRFWLFAAIGGLLFSAWCIKYTQSRSGQLVFLAVIGVFVFWRYRWKAVVLLVPVLVPALIIIAGGGDRSDAAASTEERYEAWRTAVELVKTSPIWGVGQGKFTSHHYLTAHNSYLLVAAELGMVGLFLFSMLIWMSIKTALQGMSQFRDRPEARAAEIWSVSMLAAFAGIIAGAMFLSFAYHYVLWIYLGLSAALYVCIQRHEPSFTVRLGFLDMVGVAAVDAGLYLFFDVFLRIKGF